MWSVWLVLSVLGLGIQSSSPSDSDCLTADGTLGRCSAPEECGPSYQRFKTVPCRYSRGYGPRICCPRSSLNSRYSLSTADDREDFYSNDAPIAFPGEHSYSEVNSYDPHVSALHGQSNPSFSENFDPNYQPYNPRPSYTKPQHHEKPSYNSESHSPPIVFQESPSYSHGFQEHQRPTSLDGDRERPDRYRPKPAPWGVSEDEYQPTRRTTTEPWDYQHTRKTTARPWEHQQTRRTTTDRWEHQQTKRPTTDRWEHQQTRRTTTDRWEQQQTKRTTTDRWDHRPTKRTTPQPSWAIEEGFDGQSNSNSNRKISEIKCEEYSRLVSQTIDVLPLSLNAEAVPLTVQKCGFSAVKLIVGGVESELGEFPHMAAVGYHTVGSRQVMWNCGGTLISEQFVMTAGHCANTTYGNPVVVRLGEYNLERDNDGAEPEDYRVEQVIVHPNYFKSLKYNDIALLRLDRSVRFNKWIRPACLPLDDSIRAKPLATGWGRTDFVGRQSDVLMKVSLNIIDNRQCNSFYSTNSPVASSSFSSGIVDTMLCAGELEGGRDTCLGDSGGPLSITKKENPCIHYVIGITSFGKICGAPRSPGVYTRVSKYLSWIERTVWS